MPKTCLLSAIKNEGPDLLEWACYHHLIGFDHLLVYSNDCTDGSDDLLDAIAALGWLTHRRHTPPKGIAAQDAVADLAIKDPVLTAADWAMWLDADEFLLIHAGQGRLPDLIAAARGADALALNWRNFGDNGHDTTDDSLVLARFTQGMTLQNPQSRSVKTLFRLGPQIEGLAIHRPLFTPQTDITMRDGAGKPLGDAFKFGRKSNNRPRHRVPEGRQSWRIGQINHYPIKALDRVGLKLLRGRGMDPAAPGARFNLEYLTLFNHNQIEDRAIQSHLPALRAALACALENPAIARAFATCREKDAQRRQQVVEFTAELVNSRGKPAPPPAPQED